MVNDNKPDKINHFFPGPIQDNDNTVSAEIIQQLQKDFIYVFTVIGCFDGTFSLHVKLDSKPYQALPRQVASVLLKPFKEELEWFQQTS